MTPESELFLKKTLELIAKTSGCLSEDEIAKYEKEYTSIKEIIEKINAHMEIAAVLDQADNFQLSTRKEAIQSIFNEAKLYPDAWQLEIKLSDERIFDAIDEEVIIKKEMFESSDKKMGINPPKDDKYLSLEDVFKQLKEVLLGEMDIDRCGIPEGAARPVLFATSPEIAVSNRMGNIKRLKDFDKYQYHELCYDLIEFIYKNKSHRSLNTNVAKIICSMFKDYSLNKSDYNDIKNTLQDNGIIFEEYIYKVKGALQECSDLSMIIDAYLNPRKILAFSSNYDNSFKLDESTKNTNINPRCSLM